METWTRIFMRIRKAIGWFVKGIRRNIRSMSREQKRRTIIALLALIVGGICGGFIGRSIEKKISEEKVAEAVSKVEKEDKTKLDAVKKELYDLKEDIDDTALDKPWNLVLVNYEHPMKEGYVPELKELEPGYSVDSRIADEARQMLADAKEAGLHIIMCSAYRSVERQKTLFDECMREYIKSGMGHWDAYQETVLKIAEPGESEHALGLALDLISNQYTELDKRQETTKEAKWLAENCHKYGFILRYPPEKTEITGIIYEPWHYRYVGEEHAKKIHELGVTLEEYLQDHYVAEGQ